MAVHSQMKLRKAKHACGGTTLEDILCVDIGTCIKNRRDPHNMIHAVFTFLIKKEYENETRVQTVCMGAPIGERLCEDMGTCTM